MAVLRHSLLQLYAAPNVTFLSLNKKVTKENSIGKVLRKSALPYVPHPPHRHPTGENVPIFACRPEENFPISEVQVFKNRNIFEHRTAERRRGFLRGHALSECPLKSPSFGPFLGEPRKGHIFYLQQSMLYCNASMAAWI